MNNDSSSSSSIRRSSRARQAPKPIYTPSETRFADDLSGGFTTDDDDAESESLDSGSDDEMDVDGDEDDAKTNEYEYNDFVVPDGVVSDSGSEYSEESEFSDEDSEFSDEDSDFTGDDSLSSEYGDSGSEDESDPITENLSPQNL